jgi:hypothetical protein
MDGKLVYKCRRCGAEDRSTHVPNIISALFNIMYSGKTPIDWGHPQSKMTDVHQCVLGTYGVSDLIGGEQN